MGESIKNTPELYLIALIKKEDSELGFRLFDLGNNEVASVKATSVLKQMYKRKARIKNLEYLHDLYDYLDEFEDYKESMLSNLDYNMPTISCDEDMKSERNRLAILRDDDGFVWVRYDGVYQYESSTSFKEKKSSYYNLYNVYYYQDKLAYSSEAMILKINDSIYRDKIIKLKVRSLKLEKQADIIKISGACKGLKLNNFGEAYVDTDVTDRMRKSNEPIKIELPANFNKLSKSNGYIFYDQIIHLIFNRNLKEIGESALEGLSSLRLIQVENCYLTSIESNAFKDTELVNTVGNGWCFNKPCHIHNSAFLKSKIAINKTMLLNIDRIDKYGFGYARFDNELKIFSTKTDGYGVIEDNAFIGIKIDQEVILGNNIELRDRIFEFSNIEMLVLDSENIKVVEGCKPFKSCKIINLVISENCTRIPDNLFDGADIECIKILGGSLSVGKRSFANLNINKRNAHLFELEFDLIDDMGFENLIVDDIDNIPDIEIKACKINNFAFRNSKLSLDTLNIICDNVGEGMFNGSELRVGNVMSPRLYVGMFENAKIYNSYKSFDSIDRSFKAIQDNKVIPDRAFKNVETNADIINDLVKNQLTCIGKEAFKNFKDTHKDDYGDTLYLAADMIDTGAFENSEFSDNITRFDIRSKDIRERAFKNMSIDVRKRFIFDEFSMELFIEKIGRAAFNGLRNFRSITLHDTIESQVQNVSIDDDNFKFEPDIIKVYYTFSSVDNRNILSKFSNS